MNNPGAHILRDATGTSGLETTLRTAVLILAHFEIPHLVAGGLAVQEYGYHRVTLDVDLIVPDVIEAAEFLTADLSGPFVRIPDWENRVRDQRNEVFVDLLPAGRVLQRGCRVPFPAAREVAEDPRFVTLEQLISLKLDSWSHTPVRRHKDKTDVIELINALHLPRELNVAEPVRHHYLVIWDALLAEPPESGPTAPS